MEEEGRYIRPGTQYRVNTRIRDGEVNLDNSTVEEETYGSVRDRIAGFNKTGENDSFAFNNSYNPMSLERQPRPLMNSTASTLDTTSSNVTYREETQESSSDESTLSIKSNPNQFVQNAEKSSTSSSSESEPELTPVKNEIESEMKASEEIVTSVMRVKLNDREDEVDSARIEKSEIAAAQSAFEDGLTTTDELDEEIIENHIYIFKGPNNSWRVGPDLNSNRAFLNSNNSKNHEGFMDDEKHCSSFNIWMEYTKHGWVTAGLFRVRQMELGGKTKGVVNGTFQSKWKSNAIPGIYEQYEDAENGIYYRRTAFVRGRPDMAYFPKGEEDPDFVPRRPEYTYRTELIRNVDDFNTINQTSPEMNSFVNLILNQDDMDKKQLNDSLASIKNSSADRIILPDEFFLYEYDGTWRIGKDFNKPDCWAFTNQTNLSKMLTATWFESAKTKNKREITVQISPSIHRDDFVYITADLLTYMKGQSISGAYMKENDGVYKHVKSLHLNGKFQTEFKQASLPGWYDQINPKQYVKRDEEENFFIYQREGRWQIGPDPNSKLCWLFSTKTEKGCDEYIRWFEPVKDKWTRNRTVTVAPVK